MTQDTSFDRRIVRYEEIHSIKAADFVAMVKAAEIHGACHILDCGSGYGAVTREVLRAAERNPESRQAHLAIDLIDESAVQIERAKLELQPWHSFPGVTLAFITGTFPQDLNSPPASYDVVFCKMVLHEINRGMQPSFLASTYDYLRAGGRLVFWDVCLPADIADFYRGVVRMKDSLAGYDTMVQRRNFLTETEIRNLFAQSPFGSVEFVRDISYRFDTRKRLIPEFGGDHARFDKWQRYIRSTASEIPPATLNSINYTDDGPTITFDVRKVIGIARRMQTYEA